MPTSNLIPAIATHPGEVLKDELDSRDIRQIDFAHSIDMSNTMLNEIIKGKRNITADNAILLEKALDISAEFWLKMQSQYDIDAARIKQRNIEKLQLVELWKSIASIVPVAYLKKRNILTNNLKEDISIIKDIYRALNFEGIIEAKAPIAGLFRKSSKLQIDENNLTCWVMLARWEAQNQAVGTYVASCMPTVKQQFIQIVNQNIEVVGKTEELLKSYGIKFIILEKPDKVPVDGFSFFNGSNPAIAITLRKGTIDNFAFSILHELAHIEMHLNPDQDTFFIDCFDIEDNKKDSKEMEADLYAQQALIPQEVWRDLYIPTKIFDDSLLRNFAEKTSIHPAFVLGRYCHESGNYKIKTSIDRKIG